MLLQSLLECNSSAATWLASTAPQVYQLGRGFLLTLQCTLPSKRLAGRLQDGCLFAGRAGCLPCDACRHLLWGKQRCLLEAMLWQDPPYICRAQASICWKMGCTCHLIVTTLSLPADSGGGPLCGTRHVSVWRQVLALWFVFLFHIISLTHTIISYSFNYASRARRPGQADPIAGSPVVAGLPCLPDRAQAAVLSAASAAPGPCKPGRPY